MRKAFALPLLIALAACQQGEEVTDCAATGADSCAKPAPAQGAASEPQSPAEAALDKAALNERKDPEKLLAYLSAAINGGKWDDAAQAWPHGETSGAQVKELFGNPGAALVTFGKGQQEGAAGSLYYEAPILLLVDGASKEGTITLRRVNDVDGAEDWQLRWHVERLEWK